MLQKLLPTFLAAIFIAIFAQITILLPYIPITGQSFAVLLVAYLLGWNRGMIAVLLYLFVGAIGLPVFADGASGIAKLKGNSGGFLYGFVVAAFVVGSLAENTVPSTFKKALGIMALGTAVILFFGVMHLSIHIGFQKALQYGLYPFIAGAVVKIVLGAAIGDYLKSKYDFA
ncbi:MAG: biotin transporter BioY [Chitinophagales bacterium]